MNKKNISKKKDDRVLAAKSGIKSPSYYIVVFLFWFLYLYLTFQAPVTTNQFNLSKQTLDLLRISIAVPYLLIWISAMYAYIKIKRYSVAISPSKESQAFGKIATGILFLVSSLILSTITSALRNFLSADIDMRPILTILTNYVYIWPYLVAFLLLFRGVTSLIQNNDKRTTIGPTLYMIIGIPILIFAYIWLELIFANPHRLTAGSGSLFATYYIKDSLLILTIIIPALIAWVTGLYAILKLWKYQKSVSGKIYRRALTSFVYGFMGVILGSVFLQGLLSMGTQRLINIGLAGILQLIYFFIFLQILGFSLIARGASKLTKIEEV